MRMFLSIIVTVGVLLTLAGSTVWAGQRVVEDWVARYDNSGNSEYAHAMAMDDDGNVYITGESMGPTTSYVTVKYDPNGDEKWVAHSDGMEVGPAIAVDVLGNVFLAGVNMAGDYTTFKLDPNGNELWVASYNGPGNGWDRASDIALDGSGGVYITGYSFGDGTLDDYTTIKYNSDSNEPVWVARYNGPANDTDRSSIVALDSAGNVYVTGVSRGIGTYYDIVTIKYDPEGNELWVAKYNGPENGPDYVEDMTLDSAGNVYVAGAVNYSSFYGTGDYVTIKYATDSNESVWVATYNGPGNAADGVRGIAVDGSGSVYVTGSSDGGGTENDYATIKYNADGNEVWVARYNGPANSRDYGECIALDGSGSVYVTGGSHGTTYSDYATIKYDANGIELWTVRYDGPVNGTDYPYGLALDGSGQVYVAGSSYGSGTYSDYAAIKYVQCIQMGDIDCDKDVDFGDFAVLGQYWTEKICGDCGWADLDDDGDVDSDDLKKLAQNWLEGKD
jgi:hypothetical protein